MNLKSITFSRNPAVWVSLIGAVGVLFVQSGVSPELTSNAGALSVLITAAVGIVTRLFVSPTAKPAV